MLKLQRPCSGTVLRLLSPLWCRDQRASLVNSKLKWVRDRSLDHVVSRERHLRPVLLLIHQLNSSPRPLTKLNLGLMKLYPSIFKQSSKSSSRSSSFSLTDTAIQIRKEELVVQSRTELETVDRLRRLLMMTLDSCLPVQAINQLSFDFGLPFDFCTSLLPRYQQFFEIFQSNEQLWIKLLSRDPSLAVSELEKNSNCSNFSSDSSVGQGEDKRRNIDFPISFPRGFGLPRKWTEWLREWQTLPYRSPYSTESPMLDRRTDESEKRNVGVFHELLHLTVAKKTERRNVSNLRKPLGMPQKFTKVFERHSGIFYISQKLATQTVVLREAYASVYAARGMGKHPIQVVRDKYVALMRTGIYEEVDEDGESNHIKKFSDECTEEYFSAQEKDVS